MMKGILAAAAAALAAAGCGDSESGTGASTAAARPLAVATAFYPVDEAARAVGGDRANVTNLTPPGSEPHDIELTADAVAGLETADVVLYLGNGFQPGVEKAIANLPDAATPVDLLAGLDLRTNDPAVPGIVGEVDQGELADRKDPHVWVDPQNFETMVGKVRDALVAADPDGTATYTANANAYLTKIMALDAEFAAGLASCRGKVLVTSHAAFGYLTDRYKLVQAPIAGISPEEEPDPKSLAATAAFAKKNGVKTVYFESLVPKDLAQTVADEIGAKTDALDPVEGIPQDQIDAGATYLSIQRDNLKRLVSGLGCTTG
jgi:zinc transport system substrate-binding protein